MRSKLRKEESEANVIFHDFFLRLHLRFLVKMGKEEREEKKLCICKNVKLRDKNLIFFCHFFMRAREEWGKIF